MDTIQEPEQVQEEAVAAVEEQVGAAEAAPATEEQKDADSGYTNDGAIPEVSEDVAGDDVGGDAIEQFATEEEEVAAVEEPVAEGEAVEAADGEEAAEEPAKVPITEALADFNHELFWPAFRQEVTRVIDSGKIPKALVVPADRAHKLLLSAYKNFDQLKNEVKDPDELIFNFQKPVPEGSPEGTEPEATTIRVVVSEVLPSSRKVDVMLLI